jgi:hypothetical protein
LRASFGVELCIALEVHMGKLTLIAWCVLALVHTPPAAVVAWPELVGQLYGETIGGTLQLLLVHRGVLFLAVVMACIHAAFIPSARRVTSLVVGTSVVGFLFLYARAGMPAGPLETIALFDAIALAPLAWVVIDAWRPQAA